MPGQVVLQEAGVRRGVELAQPEVRRRRVQVARGLAAGRSGSPRRSCRRAGAPGRRRTRRRTGGRRVSRFRQLDRAGGRVPSDQRSRPTGWSNSRTCGARIHTASGSPPPARGRQVGSAGVAEVAEPVVVRRPGVDLRLERREHVVADDRGLAAGVPDHLAPGGVVRQRHVVLVQPADQRPAPRPLPRAAAVEPEAARVRGGDLAEERRPGRVIACSRKFATIAAPCSDRIDSGWNWTPSSGRSTCRTPITAPVLGHVRGGGLQGVGQLDRGERVVPDGTECLGRPRNTPCPSWLDPGHLAVRGHVAVDGAAVRRHQALHAQADAEHRAGRRHAGRRDRPRSRRGRPGGPGPGDRITWVCRSTSSASTSSCWTTRGSASGDGGDEVHEVPRVGVVVVHDHHVRGGHRHNLLPEVAALPRDGVRPRVTAAHAVEGSQLGAQPAELAGSRGSA